MRYPSAIQSLPPPAKWRECERSHFRKCYRCGTLAWEPRLSVQILSLGKHNPRLADIRRAINHGSLTRDGMLPVEGPKLVEEAQRSGLEIVAVFFRKDTTLPALPTSVPVYEIEPAVFKTIQSTETSQGVVALIKPQHYSMTDVI